VNCSYTSSDDDQTGCEPEIKHEKEDAIKCVWLNNTLLDMVVQDEVNGMELHVDIAVEVQEQDPLEFLPHAEGLKRSHIPTTMLNTF
jgi:hypothetical protein